MSSDNTLDPALFLQSLMARRCAVKLKWGQLYVGTLKSVDSFMNVLLENCFEHESNGEATELGDVLVRCNNVLYVRELPATGAVPDLFPK